MLDISCLPRVIPVLPVKILLIGTLRTPVVIVLALLAFVVLTVCRQRSIFEQAVVRTTPGTVFAWLSTCPLNLVARGAWP